MQDLPKDNKNTSQINTTSGTSVPPDSSGSPSPADPQKTQVPPASQVSKGQPLPSQPIPKSPPQQSQDAKATQPSSQQQVPPTPQARVAPPASRQVPPQQEGELPKVPTIDSSGIPDQPKKKKSYKFLLVILLLFLLLLVPSGVLGAGILVAYGKIPFENQELRKEIVQFVFSLPFIPKTPEYVLQRSILAHQDVSKAHFDASIASSSQSITNILNTSNFDMSLVGAVDASDKDSPLGEVQVKFADQLDLELRLIDKNLYFRVNKIPTVARSMLSAMGIDANSEEFSRLLGIWIHNELSTLDTNAREALKESKEEENVFDEAYQEFVERLLREKILPNVEMTSEELGGSKMYKIHLDLSEDLIDEIFEEIGNFEEERRGKRLDIQERGTRPSELIKKLVFDVWIDRSFYYLRKLNVHTTIDNTAVSEGLSGVNGSYGSLIPSLNESVDMVFSLELLKVGETVNVIVPSDYMSLEEFMTEAMKLMGVGGFVGSMEQQKLPQGM